jgi:hypothetical protein
MGPPEECLQFSLWAPKWGACRYRRTSQAAAIEQMCCAMRYSCYLRIEVSSAAMKERDKLLPIVAGIVQLGGLVYRSVEFV